jgi:hypothetical protein
MDPGTTAISTSNMPEAKLDEHKDHGLWRDFVGIEGCAATSLSKLKLFKEDESTIKTYLDQTMVACLPGYRTQFNDPEMELSKIGTLGYNWHIDIIRAMLESRTAFTLTEVPPTKLINDKTNRFLVDGKLNASYVKIRGAKRTRLEHAYDGPEDEDSEIWNHSIAVDKGKIRCNGVADSGVATSNLWLNKEGIPNVRKGYMRAIRKVYRVDTQP